MKNNENNRLIPMNGSYAAISGKNDVSIVSKEIMENRNTVHMTKITSIITYDEIYTFFFSLDKNVLSFRNANNNRTLQYFSHELSLLGIEYVVINKGPYVPGDPISSFIGKARVYPAGFPWDLSYLPSGSWQNWSKVFRNDSYLKPVMNQSNWIVLQNSLYSGCLCPV